MPATLQPWNRRRLGRTHDLKSINTPYGCIVILFVDELADDFALCVHQRSNEHGTGRAAKIPYGAVAWCRRSDLYDVSAWLLAAARENGRRH